MTDIMNNEIEKLAGDAAKLYTNHKYIDAINVYSNLLTIPDCNNKLYAKYNSNISMIYHNLRNFQESIRYAEQAILDDPTWYKGYYRMAKACEGLLDYEKSREYYDKMISLNVDIDASILNDYHNHEVNILREWIVNNGGSASHIKLEYYDVDYRGTTVSKNIKPNENIIEIPWKCILSMEESKNNYFNKILSSSGTRFNSPHTWLALELLDIKYTPDHFKQPIIKCLPKYFSNIPINFDAKELNELEGSYTLVKIQQKLQYLQIEYDNIIGALGKMDIKFPYTFKDFVWARTCIITRVYAITRNEISDTVMVPFADMANHVIPANTHWYFNNDSEKFTVHATKNLQRGDVLYESYGQKCNYRYFVNYGFTVDNNPFEEATMIFNPILLQMISRKLYVLEINESGSYKTDNQYLNYLNTAPDIFQVGYDIKTPTFQAMLDYCRKSAIENIKVESLDIKLSEIHVCNMIINIANMMIDQFNETFEDDEMLLKTYTYNFNMRNCIIQRKEEKKVYKFLINYFEFLKALLETNDIKIKAKIIKKMKKKFTGMLLTGFIEYAVELSKIKI